MLYIVTYDLRKKEKDYTPFFEQLESFPDWAHPFESTWFIKSRNDSSKILDRNDQIFITEIGKNSEACLTKDMIKWLQKND